MVSYSFDGTVPAASVSASLVAGTCSFPNSDFGSLGHSAMGVGVVAAIALDVAYYCLAALHVDAVAVAHY